MPIAPPIGSLTRLNSNIKDILSSLFQLNHTETTIFILLLKSSTKKPPTIDQIAEKTKLDRTTCFRACQKLIHEGLGYKENLPLPGQGYVQVYHSITKEEFKIEVEKRIGIVKEGLERLSRKIAEDIDLLLES